MKVAITGATGFLGGALLRELINNGYEVVALVRDLCKAEQFRDLKNLVVVETDLVSAREIPEIVGCEVFYHLAWSLERGNFDEQYKSIGIMLNCLKLAKNAGCKHFLGVGSQAEYGETNEQITEETATNPTEPYGAAKLAAYYLGERLANQLGIGFIWARMFSVYGDNDKPYTLYSRLTLELVQYGEITLTSDGSHIWNYLHEIDAARALRLLTEIETCTGIYNVASSLSMPLKNYIEILRQRHAPNAKVIYGTQRCAVNLRVSTEKLRNSIGEFEERCNFW